MHDPAKVLLDLAVTPALGGDCLADIAVLRAEPGVHGPVASDPSVSRTIDALAVDAPQALATINAGRAAARAAVWQLAGTHAPDHEVSPEQPLVVDIDATPVTSHSEEEDARPTCERGFGHHPLWAFVDHGEHGSGETLAVLLRPGDAGSTTTADHITVPKEALRQLPGHQSGRRPGREVLVRIDGAGATRPGRSGPAWSGAGRSDLIAPQRSPTEQLIVVRGVGGLRRSLSPDAAACGCLT